MTYDDNGTAKPTTQAAATSELSALKSTFETAHKMGEASYGDKFKAKAVAQANIWFNTWMKAEFNSVKTSQTTGGTIMTAAEGVLATRVLEQTAAQEELDARQRWLDGATRE